MAGKLHSILRSVRPAARGLAARGRAPVVRLAAATACCLGFAAAARCETISSSAYRIDVKNSAVWYDSKGNLVSRADTGSRLSVLERWSLQSQPIVSITNLSTDTALIGAQLDLSKSAAKIVSCTWLEAPATAAWNWNAAAASAFFQFLDPIAPGGVVSMRLGTAARTGGLNPSYAMNQTLFHPTVGDCLTTNSSFGAFTLFWRPNGDPAAPVFGPAGQPVPAGTAQTLSFAGRPILDDAITTVNGVTSSIVPVPEPQTAALAASALLLVAGWRGLRRRAA